MRTSSSRLCVSASVRSANRSNRSSVVISDSIITLHPIGDAQHTGSADAYNRDWSHTNESRSRLFPHTGISACTGPQSHAEVRPDRAGQEPADADLSRDGRLAHHTRYQLP